MTDISLTVGKNKWVAAGPMKWLIYLPFVVTLAVWITIR
jgi:hypothetical protein